MDIQITKRQMQLAPLTHAQVDQNFTNLKAGVDQLAVDLSAGLTFTQIGAGAVARTLPERGRDIINVNDFGLVGNGTTGNSANLLATLADLHARLGNCELAFSHGDYVLDSSITIDTYATLRFQAGARLVIPNGVTLTLNTVEMCAGLQQIFQCVGTGKVVGSVRNALILPEWWGAIADGLHPPNGTDFSDRAAAAARNGPALQAALSFAGYNYSINGITGAVGLTSGGYVSDRELFPPLSVNVVGSGIGCAIFLYAATGNCLSLINTNNSLVSDVFLAPIGGPTWNFSTGYGLYCKNVSTPCVRNVWSSGFGAGTFYFENVIEGRISGLISDNSNGPAFVIRGVGQGTVLSNCVTAGTDGGACFDIQSGYDWHLIGCTAKDGGTGTNGYYLNACENINLTACGAHSINREGIVLTASTLNCTLTSCFVNDASTSSPGTYAAMSISGTRNKLIAPKVTGNTPTYNYGITLFGGATDCSVVGENVTPGTQGAINDQQPIGANTYHVRKVSTTDATVKTLWTKALNNNAGAVLEATVTMKQRGSAGESATFKVWARASTDATGSTIATGSIYSSKSNAGSTVSAALVLTNAAANAGVVSLQIAGLAAGNPIDWEATVNVVSVTG